MSRPQAAWNLFVILSIHTDDNVISKVFAFLIYIKIKSMNCENNII